MKNWSRLNKRIPEKSESKSILESYLDNMDIDDARCRIIHGRDNLVKDILEFNIHAENNSLSIEDYIAEGFGENKLTSSIVKFFEDAKLVFSRARHDNEEHDNNSIPDLTADAYYGNYVDLKMAVDLVYGMIAVMHKFPDFKIHGESFNSYYDKFMDLHSNTSTHDTSFKMNSDWAIRIGHMTPNEIIKYFLENALMGEDVIGYVHNFKCTERGFNKSEYITMKMIEPLLDKTEEYKSFTREEMSSMWNTIMEFDITQTQDNMKALDSKLNEFGRLFSKYEPEWQADPDGGNLASLEKTMTDIIEAFTRIMIAMDMLLESVDNAIIVRHDVQRTSYNTQAPNK